MSELEAHRRKKILTKEEKYSALSKEYIKYDLN